MTRFLLPVICVISSFFISAYSALAAPITNAISFAFLDNEQANEVGTGEGLNFTFGVVLVEPNGDDGTTATATNTASSRLIDPLPNFSSVGNPGLFGADIPIAEAQNNNELTSWDIVLTNEGDSSNYSTPDRTTATTMEFVENLAITGSGLSPTVSWGLPTTGSSVSRVSYNLWNVDTQTQLTNLVVFDPTGTAVKLDFQSEGISLVEGTRYAIRIIPEYRDETIAPSTSGTASRSSNWLSWTATSGDAEGQVLSLTTGSPVNVSQLVDTPDETFSFEFDYFFTTTTGYLEVFINEMLVGTTLTAPSTIADEFYHAVFEVEEALLFSLLSVPLKFTLDGLTGSNVLIDNIVFPELVNGDFEQGLSLWTVEGPGRAGVAPVPEPTTMLLFGTGLLGLIGISVRRKKN